MCTKSCQTDRCVTVCAGVTLSLRVYVNRTWRCGFARVNSQERWRPETTVGIKLGCSLVLDPQFNQTKKEEGDRCQRTETCRRKLGHTSESPTVSSSRWRTGSHPDPMFGPVPLRSNFGSSPTTSLPPLWQFSLRRVPSLDVWVDAPRGLDGPLTRKNQPRNR